MGESNAQKKSSPVHSLIKKIFNGYLSKIKLSFSDAGKKYNATIYADAKGARYETNPQACTIKKKMVSSKTGLSLKAAPGGGFAISIIEVAATK